MRALLGIFLSFSFYIIKGQVGINNPNPKATLHVASLPEDNTKIDGFIPPILTGEQLKSKDNLYGNDQDGVVVYVNTPLAPASTTPKTKNVLDKGYYSFNSSLGAAGEWKALMKKGSERISGGELGSVYTGNKITLQSRNGQGVSADVVSRTFSINRPMMLHVNFSVPIQNVSPFGNPTGILNDGASKLLGAYVELQEPNQNNFRYLSREVIPFTNHANDYTSGFFQVNGGRTVLLVTPGVYTIKLVATIYAFDSNGVLAEFSDNNNQETVFDVFLEYPD